jgi:hypothetical protein
VTKMKLVKGYVMKYGGVFENTFYLKICDDWFVYKVSRLEGWNGSEYTTIGKDFRSYKPDTRPVFSRGNLDDRTERPASKLEFLLVTGEILGVVIERLKQNLRGEVETRQQMIEEIGEDTK